MKLHELLAVENSLETQANKCRADLKDTFEKKRHLFEEKVIQFTPNTEGSQTVTESQSDIQTTVAKELDWISKHLARSWDASYQVAESNTAARADITLEDGTVLASQVPATALLELQKRMADLLSLAQAIPTLDPAKGFKPDKQRGDGYYKARDVRKKRTSKQVKPIVKSEAIIKDGVGLPAQVELINFDVETGVIEEQEWSALMTPADKAELLNRIEQVGRSVRSARSRANDQAVLPNQIASKLLGYIFG